MSGVDLTLAAQEDLTQIWSYTYATWGLDQAEEYYSQIVSCCEAIGCGTARSRRVERLTDDIHVHRCEQHYIFFLPTERPIVLAILHGRMDLVRRLQERLQP